jgi:hypothetical protein
VLIDKGAAMKSRQQYLSDRIINLLQSIGMQIRKEGLLEGQSRVDMVCRDEKSKVRIEFKAMNLYRAPDFRAAIGDAILRFRHENHGARSAGVRFMMAFLLQRMSRKAVEDLKEYANIYLPGLQWAILAEDGSGVISLGEREERMSVAPYEDEIHRDRGANRGSIFSSNNQWLFKVLLLSGMDSKYWGGASRRPDSVNELAAIAGVPQPSVSAFMKNAKQAGFLKEGGKDFQIQHHQELLDDWGYALKNRASHAIGLRSIYPNEPVDNLLVKLRSYRHDRQNGPAAVRIAIGGHMGCHLLGLGRSNMRQVRLYAEGEVKDLLSALDLVEEPVASAQIALLLQPNNASVFRGAVDVDGVWICDVLQCYFDVRYSYARGKEQADYIYERILQPHFEGRK